MNPMRYNQHGIFLTESICNINIVGFMVGKLIAEKSVE